MSKLILARVIYRIDYKTCFKLLDKRGELLEILSEDTYWNTVGENIVEGKIYIKRTEKKQSASLTIEPTSISGVYESGSIDFADLNRVWDTINDVVSRLGITVFNRLGIRFYFLKPIDTFEEGLNIINKQADKNFIKAFEYEKPPIDNSLTFVFEKDGLHNKFNIGPMRRAEYGNWFENKDFIEIDNGIFYDIDYSTSKYEFKTFNFDKFASTANNFVTIKINKLNSYLLNEGI